MWIKDHVEYYRNRFLGRFYPRKLADILYEKYMGGEVKLIGRIQLI